MRNGGQRGGSKVTRAASCLVANAALLGTALMMVWGGSALAAAPRLDTLSSTTAAVRDVVTITGTDLVDARVVWDAGLSTETKLAESFSANMFSVPPNAAEGLHTVTLENNDGRSRSLEIHVLGRAVNTRPRVDSVTLVSAEFDGLGNVVPVLYVQGANFDVGATILIDGQLHPSRAHKVLLNDTYGSNPLALGYPIRHYLSRVVPLEKRAIGSSLSIQVRNELGELSEAMPYALPVDEEALDSDGDGITDRIERDGFANATGQRINLHALGADPLRKDIFIELDVMEGLTYPLLPGTLDAVVSMFAAAPILAPGSVDGIHLSIDASGRVPFYNEVNPSNEIDEIDTTNTRYTKAGFSVLKTNHFTRERRGLFSYAVWASRHPLGWSGESVDFGSAGDASPGIGFFVSLDGHGVENHIVRSQAATFAHELGHHLGQRHGGDNHRQYKANYWSVMAYSWQLRSARWRNWWRQHPTCEQVYYARRGARDGETVSSSILDYSEGMGPQLSETSATLSESMGVCGQPIDWNEDGRTDGEGVRTAVDLDAVNSGLTSDIINDFPNWRNLRFDGKDDASLTTTTGAP